METIERFINLNEEQEDENNFSRFKLYYHKKKTEKNSDDLLSSEELVEVKDDLKNYREKQDYEEITKSPELEKGIDECKEQIIKLGEKLGIDFQNSLVNNQDIHLLSEEEYNKKHNLGSNSCEAGAASVNEIFVKKEAKGKEREQEELIYSIRHELLHTASKRNIFIENGPDGEVTGVTCGYSKDQEIGKELHEDRNSSFNNFNEGLTELTNRQLSLENGCDNKKIAYGYGVILIAELTKDLSQKTEKVNEDILSQFQTGMFESKRGYLKIISDIYGKEALIALREMGNDKENIINVARLFKLEDAIEKMENFANDKIVEINIGENICEIETNEVKENKKGTLRIGGKEINPNETRRKGTIKIAGEEIDLEDFIKKQDSE